MGVLKQVKKVCRFLSRRSIMFEAMDAVGEDGIKKAPICVEGGGIVHKFSH